MKTLFFRMLFAPEDGEGGGGGGGGGGNPPVETSPGGSQSNGAADWKASISPELHASLVDVNDVNQLAQGYVHHKTELSKRALPIPSSHDEAAWSSFYDSLGRPKTADYGLKAPADPKISSLFTNEDMSKFSKMMYDTGLSPRQATSFFDSYVKTLSDIVTANETEAANELQAANTSVQKEFGTVYNERMALADKVMTTVVSKDTVDFLTREGLVDHPYVKKMFAEIGSKISEHSIQRGDSSFVGRSPAEAQERISVLNRDKSFTDAYLSLSHPGHADAVKEMETLYKQAYPS